MFIEKRIKLEFNKEEKDVIQNMIDLKESFKSERVCDYLVCGDCPFDKICNYDTAEEFIEDLNENIDE